MKSVVIGATLLALACSTPAHADQWQGSAGNAPPPPRPAGHARLIGLLVGAGAGVGLGLLTGLKTLPEATCKDGKVISMASAFGAGGALAGYALTRNAEDFAYRTTGADRSRTAHRMRADEGPLPTFKFSRPALSATSAP